MSSKREWIVYILQCADNTLYTGITNNLEKRLQDHAAGKGAKYTRGRGPYTVIFTEKHPARGDALRREAEIKVMKKSDKIHLCST
jgi:putative endonuclease